MEHVGESMGEAKVETRHDEITNLLKVENIHNKVRKLSPKRMEKTHTYKA